MAFCSRIYEAISSIRMRQCYYCVCLPRVPSTRHALQNLRFQWSSILQPLVLCTERV